MKFKLKKTGFTLIELLIVIGIIAILSGIVIIAINPTKQFAEANNTERQAEIKGILDALNQYAIDHRGHITDLIPVGYVTGTSIDIVNGPSAGVTEIDLSSLSPTYLAPALPFDPKATNNHDTGYDFNLDADGILKISAPESELGIPIILVGRAS